MATTTFKSVDEYIDTQPEAAQTVLRRVRALIRTALPGAEEVISYQIPAFRLTGGPFIWFAGWKQHYSLYPVNGRLVEALKDELAPYELRKSTLRLPLSEPVPSRLIGRIAKFRAKEAAGRTPSDRAAPAGKGKKLWKFSGRLFRPDGPGLMTVLPIPSNVIRAGGLHARQRLKGRIDGIPIASSLMSSGNGWFALVVNKEILSRLGRAAGDPVKVELELDRGPAVVAAPPALRAALKAEPRAKATFDKLAPSHRKAYAQWISSAKRAETQDRRARSAVQMLMKGQTLS
jgi:uncharacterized protein YdhG (YjbR/CyaY superfamily)